jgi:hypothetical protein
MPERDGNERDGDQPSRKKRRLPEYLRIHVRLNFIFDAVAAFRS